MRVQNNLLDDAEYRPSPNHGGLIVPRVVVIHYTGDNSLEGALSWLRSRKSQVSAHLVIGKKGELFQLVPFNLRAWHAGRSWYDGQSNVNGFSIGIENVGFGDKWPDAQVNKLMECLEAITAAYDIEAIVGHADVAPGRKLDPGPNFPWELVEQKFPELVIGG